MRFSYISFDSIQYQETIREILEAKGLEELDIAKQYTFSADKLILLEKELL